MNDFIRAEAAVQAELESAAAAAPPADGRWDELAAPFRARGEGESALRVTVNAQLPNAPYGEKTGALRAFLRRVLRRCLRWYIEPLVRQQNRVNRELAREVERLEARVRALEEQKDP